MSWRGTRRPVDVLFGNIRDTEVLPDDALRAAGDRWKLVIDYPFDQGHTPHDDLARLDRWRDAHGDTQTVCWVPAFFSQSLQRDVRRLGIVRHILKDERLAQYTEHLSPGDRQQAAGILSDLRSALEQRVAGAIRQAYGLERTSPDTIDTSHGIEDRLQSLTAGLTPQLPVGTQMSDALPNLVDQMLTAQYPAHPKFETEIRKRDLRIVLEEVQRATQTSDGRIEVPSDRRKVMRQIAAPLKLGIQYEAPFLLSTHWKDVLDRAVAVARQAGEERITVKDVRVWITAAEPMGLQRDVESLIVLCYAAHTSRTFQLRGGPVQPTVDRLDDEIELVTAVMPSEPSWREAVVRAGAILGLASINPAYNPSSFEALVFKLRERGRALMPDAESLVSTLERRLAQLGIDPQHAPRAVSARAGAALTQALVHATADENVIEQFAAADVPSSAAALGTSLSSAPTVSSALQDPRWEVLALASQRAAAGEAGFARVIADLGRTLERDEFAQPLAAAVEAAATAAVELLADTTPAAPVPPAPPVAPGGPRPDPAPEPGPGVSIQSGNLADVGLDLARQELDKLVGVPGEVRVDLSWTITTIDDR